MISSCCSVVTVLFINLSEFLHKFALFFFSSSHLESGTMIKILPLDILVASHRIPWKNKNAVYRFQISSLVPEIFVFEKNVKYANEMTDDVIYSTQYYMMYTNRAILTNLHRRPLKLGRLIVLKGTHQRLQKFCSHGNSLFQSPPT